MLLSVITDVDDRGVVKHRAPQYIGGVAEASRDVCDHVYLLSSHLVNRGEILWVIRRLMMQIMAFNTCDDLRVGQIEVPSGCTPYDTDVAETPDQR